MIVAWLVELLALAATRERWARRLVGDDIAQAQAVVAIPVHGQRHSEGALIADAGGLRLLTSPREESVEPWSSIARLEVVVGATGHPNAIKVRGENPIWEVSYTPLSPGGGEYTSSETRRLVAAMEAERPPAQ